MKKKQCIFIISVLLTGIICISSCKKSNEVILIQEDSFVQKIEMILKDSIASHGVAGVNVYIQNAGGEVCNIGVGLADISSNTPMLPNTKMRVASISKTFLATVVLQLWEEGLLEIDSLMSKYLPDSIVSMFSYGDMVSLRQLLNHTSGIYDFEDPEFVMILFGNPSHHWTPYELLDHSINADSSYHFQPGTAYSYSNTNYILLGLIVESLTDISMEQNIRNRILIPLQLSNTFSYNEGIPQENYATGYHQLDETTILEINDQTMPMYFEWGHGQMVSTPMELNTFFTALTGGELFQKEATLNAMMAFTPISDFTYGLGMEYYNEVLGLGHTGDTGGFITFVMINPEKETSIIICFNTHSPTIGNAVILPILEII